MKESCKYTKLSLPIMTILMLAMFLASHTVSADGSTSVVDEINITVPVSCTLSGTGMNTHNANINNGQYNSAIGETTLKAFCNDNNGFAIYAIGYTDNEEGKNVLTNSALGSTYDITTGTASTGDNSKWAMKLATISNPAPTYPVIIAGSANDSLKEQSDPDFTDFQEIPEDYEKVAYRTAATDTGTNAEGSTLTTTYQAYISKTQPAGTYTGQVKYTLVHPYDRYEPQKPISKQVTVSYNAAQGHFGDDPTWKTNDVVYDVYCPADKTNYFTLSTPNIDANGNQESPLINAIEHEDGYYYYKSDIRIPSAHKLRIELHYDLVFNEENQSHEHGGIALYSDSGEEWFYGAGTQSFIVEGTDIEIDLFIGDSVTIANQHDYGYYIKVYPLDKNDSNYYADQPCSWELLSGNELIPDVDESGVMFFAWTDMNFNDVNLYDLDRNSIPDALELYASYLK